MRVENTKIQGSVERALAQAKSRFDAQFDSAPVMLHSIDHEGGLVKVNRRWLEAMGYDQDEVLGKKSIDFLTDSSRERALNETLPLFRRSGSARSVGYSIVRKDGQVFDVLLDAELYRDMSGNHLTLAALRDRSDEVVRGVLASGTIAVLLDIVSMQKDLKHLLSVLKGHAPETDDVTLSAPSGPVAEPIMSQLLEVADRMAAGLRATAKIQEEWLDGALEQSRELLLLVKSMDRTLRELADNIAEMGGRP